MSADGQTNKNLGVTFAVTVTLVAGQAAAHIHHKHGGVTHAGAHGATRGHHHHHGGTRYAGRHHHGGTRYAYRYGGRVIQCVAFARADAGIALSGNARDWWSNAAGIYARGLRPESGSVLSFRPTSRMPLGHVAVVSTVVDSRTILIDQSHWIGGGILRNMQVKDVSENNDWTAVRVQLPHGGAYGSIYPTHGFIYPRPDNGQMVANAGGAPMPALDPAPADLRPTDVRHTYIRAAWHHHGRHHLHRALEVAEAPASARPLDLRVMKVSYSDVNLKGR